MSVTIDDVRQAHARIRPYVHNTPVMTSERLDELAGARLVFKCEHMQKAGAFKTRGAVNAVFGLEQEVARAGVATHSSGNHGAALARAAMMRGIPAWIIVPGNAKRVKKEAIRAYGGEIVECESTLAAREEILKRVLGETGAHFVPPYDDDRIIAGQGTAALELLEDAPDLDAVITPVGGGGLLAGSAIVGAAMDVDVFGAEPEMADDAARSFRSGQRVTHHVPQTIADGLQTTLGERNFAIIREMAADILLVSEQEIVNAMRLIWTRLKQVVEPSAAVTLAVVMRYRARFAGRRLGLILTGGNLDVEQLPL